MFENADIVYKLMYLVGFALMMVINLRTYERYKLKKSVTVIITLITYVAGVAGAMIMGEAYNAIMEYNGYHTYSNVAIFGAVVFTPVFMTVAAFLLKQDWRRILDLLAPGIYVILACAKFGCFISGCCHGNECSFGIRYYNKDVTVFPIQIVEVFFMSLIIAFCFWYAFKSKRYVKGTVYPATTILYCFVRFFVEFFRYYEYEAQRHLLLGMTVWQFFCIVCIIASVIWLLALNTKKVKELDRLKLEKEAEAELLAQEQEKIQRLRMRKEKARRKK